jgi:hypothetical protein
LSSFASAYHPSAAIVVLKQLLFSFFQGRFPDPLCDRVLFLETFPIPKKIDETPKAIRIAMVASTNNVAKSILGTSWGVGSVKIQSHFLATVIPPSVIKRKGG